MLGYALEILPSAVRHREIPKQTAFWSKLRNETAARAEILGISNRRFHHFHAAVQFTRVVNLLTPSNCFPRVRRGKEKQKFERK